MKKYTIFVIFILIFIGCEEIEENRPLLVNKREKQPIFIVNRNRHFKMAEFWIDKLDNPNIVIMDKDRIDRFNLNLATKGKVFDFNTALGFYGGEYVKSSIVKMFKSISRQTKYITDRDKVPNNFFDDIYDDLNLEAIKNSVESRFALTVKYTNQKLVPIDLSLLKRRGEIYFDRNQNSALDIGTPLLVLHSNRDGRWHFVISPTSSGWVRDEDIAFGSKSEILEYLKPKNFVVTISAKSSLRVDGKYYDYVRMGVKFPILLKVNGRIVVIIPQKGDGGRLVFKNGMLNERDIHLGYLPYTPETILIQAFKFLNSPYGWGGSFGEQDCSKFIQEIYATVGLKLPRNSTTQSLIGSYLSLDGLDRGSKKDKILKFGEVGSTLIHLKGHIMLYIGEHKGEPFVIQTVWGENRRHFALGKTAVTALSFNDYIDRVDLITTIR
jgi:hypothetical protein